MAEEMIPCRIRKGWDEEHRPGMLYTILHFPKPQQSWSVVIWDDEDEPSLHKTTGLEVFTTQWQPADKGNIALVTHCTFK